MRPALRLIICASMMAALLSSCFTGIESTPRISSDEVRKHDAATLTPEQQFLSNVTAQPPMEWQPGKRFFVTDDKISIIFAPGETDASGLNGHDLYFVRFDNVPSVTGQGATNIVFSLEDRKGELVYPVDTPYDKLSERHKLEVPFTVERSVVESVDSIMKGNTYYISTPKWFSASDDKAVNGRRHIPVTISRVEAGTYIYPLRVYFIPEGETGEHWIPMTIGNDRSATRNFATVFNFDNPRKRYPQITDETWQLIINSRVKEGMTRDECRLALGAPDSYRTIPVTNAIVEQWSYSDGIYLIFEDGILTRYRI